MSGVDELVAFVRRCLAEDERVAREASPGPWTKARADSVYAEETSVVTRPPTPEPHRPEWVEPFDYVVEPQAEGREGIDPADAEHIALWDPKRVLDEVEAKRHILDVVLEYEAKIDGEWGCCHTAEQIAAGKCEATPLNEIHAVRLLAQPYAEREGWREEWRSVAA